MRAFTIRMVVFGLAVVGCFGCGKKDFPVPPNTKLPLTVSDLSYTLEGSQVTLRWTVPAGSEGLGEVMVSRSRTPLEDDVCSECPLVFQQIAVLPIPETVSPMTYSEAVARGFRYTYRVVLRMDNGREGKPSNSATVEY